MKHLVNTLILSLSVCICRAQEGNAKWPGPGQLFVGTCYQPIDRSPEEIERDIAIMKHAGFNSIGAEKEILGNVCEFALSS